MGPGSVADRDLPACRGGLVFGERGTCSRAEGWLGRRRRGQALTVPVSDKNTLGFRRKTLIRLLVKLEGGGGGTWPGYSARVQKAEEV